MKQIFDGIIIGMGAVIPGVSGSVLAMLLGVYEHVYDIIEYLEEDESNRENVDRIKAYLAVNGAKSN